MTDTHPLGDDKALIEEVREKASAEYCLAHPLTAAVLMHTVADRLAAVLAEKRDADRDERLIAAVNGDLGADNAGLRERVRVLEEALEPFKAAYSEHMWHVVAHYGFGELTPSRTSFTIPRESFARAAEAISRPTQPGVAHREAKA